MHRPHCARQLSFRKSLRGVALLACAVLALTGTPSGAARAQAPAAKTGFAVRTHRDAAGDHRYSLFLPANYTPDRKWPVILFLHGAGERGTDGTLQTTVGLGPLVRARAKTFPFIVVFPQAENPRGRILPTWQPDAPDGRRALDILAQVERDYNVDPQRRILTGWSMGGYGAWSMAAAFPERWSAVIPVSGGGDATTAERLKDVPLWAFHGGKDLAVPVAESRRMIEAMRHAGGDPLFTELANGDHDAWRLAYNIDELYAWMLDPRNPEQRRRAAAARPRPVPTATPEAAQLEPPFLPALDIPDAMYARLGNDMFAALADAIPQLVPRDALSGQLNDISDTTTAEGRTFSVYFSNISYQTQLVRAAVRAYRPDTVNVQLGLRNAVITIGSTSVAGSGKSAVAGPIQIVIGHQRPVWLSFDVKPIVAERKLRMQLLSSRFDIPDDNWYVTSPAGVSTRGLGMTSSRVSEGLVGGLYGSKYRISQQVTSVVPGLLEQLEKQIDLSAADRVVAGIWPLPVYRPRMRTWPAAVSTDERGVSITLGVTVAGIDPQNPPRQWRSVAPVGIPVQAVPRTTELRLGVAPQILGPLSSLLIESDVARIHVLDTPSKPFAQFVDPAVMAEIIPDLKRFGNGVEISAEIVMKAPMQIGSASAPELVSNPEPGPSDAPAATVAARPVDRAVPEFQLPELALQVSIRTDRSTDAWTPYAEFAINVRQGANPQLARPTSTSRALLLKWSRDPAIDIKGRFVGDIKPEDPQIDVDRFYKVFEEGWLSFTTGGEGAETPLTDLDFGFTKLRANSVEWSSPVLSASYGPAGVRITNSGSKPIVYETKGPYSGWGGPYTLEPGKSAEFQIPYPMLWRRRTGSGFVLHTLPAGSHSEFLEPPAAPAGLYQARDPKPAPATP